MLGEPTKGLVESTEGDVGTGAHGRDLLTVGENTVADGRVLDSGRFTICVDDEEEVADLDHAITCGKTTAWSTVVLPLFPENPHGNCTPMLSEIVARVEQRLKALGITAAAASLRAGLSRDAIRNMQRAAKDDARQGVSTNTLVALAPVLETTVSWLLGENDKGPVITTDDVGLVPFAGIAQAGAFFDVNLYPDDRKRFVRISKDPRYARAKQLAWRIEGDSMDSAGLYPGMFVLGVDYEDFKSIYKRYLEGGDIVVVERLRFNGQEREVTIKRYVEESEDVWLIPESKNPKHMAIMLLSDHDQIGGETVKILAYVTHGFTVLGEPFADLDYGGAFADFPSPPPETG